MEVHGNNNGVATAGLVTGITSLGTQAVGWAGSLIDKLGKSRGTCDGGERAFGYGYGVCSENIAVNRYELNQQAEITRKETEIAYLKGRDAVKNDMLELYEKLDGRFRAVEGQIAAQAVVNATTNGVLACLQGQVAALNNLTKVVIPAANICPAPMPQYNSWAAPTTTPTTAG